MLPVEQHIANKNTHKSKQYNCKRKKERNIKKFALTKGLYIECNLDYNQNRDQKETKKKSLLQP